MLSRKVIAIAAPARREIIQRLLLTQPQFELVGELSTAASLHLIAQLSVDIIILDCAAAQINPLAVLPQLRAHTRATQIIALSATNTADECALLHALGATAYVTLDQPGALLDALAAGRVSSPVRPAAQRATASTIALAQRHSRHAR